MSHPRPPRRAKLASACWLHRGIFVVIVFLARCAAWGPAYQRAMTSDTYHKVSAPEALNVALLISFGAAGGADLPQTPLRQRASHAAGGSGGVPALESAVLQPAALLASAGKGRGTSTHGSAGFSPVTHFVSRRSGRGGACRTSQSACCRSECGVFRWAYICRRSPLRS